MNRTAFEQTVLSCFTPNLLAFHSDLTGPNQRSQMIGSVRCPVDPLVASDAALQGLVYPDDFKKTVKELAGQRDSVDNWSPYRFEMCDGVRVAYLLSSKLDGRFNRRAGTIQTETHLLLPVFLREKRLADFRVEGRRALAQEIASRFETVVQCLRSRCLDPAFCLTPELIDLSPKRGWFNFIFAVNIDYHPGLTGSPSLYEITHRELRRLGYKQFLLQATTPLLLPIEVHGNRSLIFNEFGVLIGGSLLDDIKQYDPPALEAAVADGVRECGWETVAAGKTNQPDGGVDVVAYKEFERSGRVLIALQAKTGVVTAPDVRNLKGLLAREDLPFHMGIIISNAAFTKDSIWEAQRRGKKVALFTGEQLRELAMRLTTMNPPLSAFDGFPTELQLTRTLSLKLPSSEE